MRGWNLQLDAKGGTGMLILAAGLACAIFAPRLAPHDPNRQDLLNTMAPPLWSTSGSTTHPLGTDRLGQDILNRIIYGSRVSLLTACATVAGAGVLGTVLGLFAGFFGTVVQNLIMRLVDVVLAIDPVLGRDAARRRRPDQHRLVAHHVPRAGHHAHRHGLQLRRRLAARPTRSGHRDTRMKAPSWNHLLARWIGTCSTNSRNRGMILSAEDTPVCTCEEVCHAQDHSCCCA